MPTKNTKGETPARNLLIVGAVTLAAAIIIVVAFIAAANRQKPAVDTNADLLDLVRQRQSSQEKTPETGGAEPAAEPATYRGVLSSVNGDILTLIEAATNKSQTVTLTNATAITYNGAPFSKRQLHSGDEVSITAVKNTEGTLAAISIAVVVSASPTVPTVPTGENPTDLPPSQRQFR